MDETYAYLKNHSVPMAAVWMQDWVGLKSLPEGERLLWNWQLNTQHYPKWNESKKVWTEDGVRPFVYLNPMISNIKEDHDCFIRQPQFEIAMDKNYFL